MSKKNSQKALGKPIEKLHPYRRKKGKAQRNNLIDMIEKNASEARLPLPRMERGEKSLGNIFERFMDDKTQAKPTPLHAMIKDHEKKHH